MFGKVDVVAAQEFEDGFFGAPVDGELLVAFFVFEVVDFVFGEGFFLDSGEVAVQGFDVDAAVFFFVEDDGDVFFRVGDGDVDGIVFQVGFAVVVVAQVYFFVKEGVQQGADCKALLPQGFAADKRDFFHLVRRGGAELGQFLFGFCDLPHADGGFVVKFLL